MKQTEAKRREATDLTRQAKKRADKRREDKIREEKQANSDQPNVQVSIDHPMPV